MLGHQSLPVDPHLMLAVPGESGPLLPEIDDSGLDVPAEEVHLGIGRREGLRHLHTKPCRDTCGESMLSNAVDLGFLVALSYDLYRRCISPTTADSPCHCQFVSSSQLPPP